jgi:hypothetical protein
MLGNIRELARTEEDEMRNFRRVKEGIFIKNFISYPSKIFALS